MSNSYNYRKKKIDYASYFRMDKDQYSTYNFNYFAPDNCEEITGSIYPKDYYIIRDCDLLRIQLHEILDPNPYRYNILDDTGTYIGSGILNYKASKLLHNHYLDTNLDKELRKNLINTKINNYYLYIAIEDIINLYYEKMHSFPDDGDYFPDILAFRFRYIIPNNIPLITPNMIKHISEVIKSYSKRFYTVYSFMPYDVYSSSVDFITCNSPYNMYFRKYFSKYIGNFIMNVNSSLPQSKSNIE